MNQIEIQMRQKVANKKIIDVCCGGRMFHFDKANKNVLTIIYQHERISNE